MKYTTVSGQSIIVDVRGSISVLGQVFEKHPFDFAQDRPE
jgi:hypothetical protein